MKKLTSILLISTTLPCFAQPTLEGDTLPSLDELLGLEDPMGSSIDHDEIDIDSVLSPQQAGEALGDAINLMDRVATRLDQNGDVSLTTQRIQEDILRKLDQVIESAQNNQQGSGGSSSSSQSSSTSSQQQPDQQQAQQGGQQQGAPGTDAGQDHVPGGTSDAQPGTAIAPDGVSWGALPQRIRDALSQGLSDQYSDIYRSLTEEYYRSLAEDEDQ